MNVLDENIIHSQRDLLRQWRIPFRQIGTELARKGILDDDLIPFLLRLKHPTFFTRDFDYFQFRLAHPRYGLVWVDAAPDAVALFIRRFLRHPAFRTHTQRQGKVVRVHPRGLAYWGLATPQPTLLKWST